MQEQTLNRETIAQAVARKQIGNYWLGNFDPAGGFIIHYVGRSDTCLQRRLMEHATKREYDIFVIRVAESIREAFDIECREWHLLKKLNQLRNLIHPDAPSGLPYSCPYCHAQTSTQSITDEFVGGEA
jgi:hypothetical protein